MAKQKTLKAGTVSWRRKRGRCQILLVTNSSRTAWILPMGTVERGESFREAAARETAEEAGMKVRPGRSLGRLRWTNLAGRRLSAVFFLSELRGKTKWLEKNKRGRKWLSPAQALRKLAPDFRPLAAAARLLLDRPAVRKPAKRTRAKRSR